MWERWSRAVQRRPLPAALLALAVLLALAAPALGLRLGSSDASLDPPGTTTRKAYDLLVAGFGPGSNGPLFLVSDVPAGWRAATCQRKSSGFMLRLKSLPSSQYCWPMVPARFAHVGRSGSAGGLIGLKPMWQKPMISPLSSATWKKHSPRAVGRAKVRSFSGP